MVADIEQLEQMDASELHTRRLNAKEVLTPMKGEKFIFPIAEGTVKISGGDQDPRTSTLIRDSPDRGEDQDNLRGELEGSSSTSRQDSSWYDGEAKGDFWSISGDFIHRHHVEPRVKLYVLSEESFPIPLKYIDITRTADIAVDVMSEKNIEDYWNVDGDRELSDTWTCFTRFTVLSEKPPDGYTWSSWRLTRNKRPQGPTNYGPEMWKHVSACIETQREATVGNRETKLDNARRLRGIYFTDSEDEESKDIMKNARRKLEIPMPAAMPCKTSLCRSSRETLPHCWRLTNI